MADLIVDSVIHKAYAYGIKIISKLLLLSVRKSAAGFAGAQWEHV